VPFISPVVRPVPVNPSATTYSAATATAASSGSLSNVSQLDVKSGDVITQVGAQILDSASGPTKVRIQLMSRPSNSTSLSQLGVTLSSGGGSQQFITVSGSFIVAPNTDYFIVIDNFGGGTGACTLYSMQMLVSPS
jgi:hypothetical protein